MTGTEAPAPRADLLRRRLIERLVDAGAARSEWVRRAFAEVPRERFVPRFRDAGGSLVDGADPTRHDEWLHGVYADDVLVTQLRPGSQVVDPAGLPTSSSSAPTVMAGMLEELDLRPGQRVLEVGTGTGYNAALLCQRVGAASVTSVELDPELADAARVALTGLGLRPHIHAGDGAAGVPDRGPFDRIIATASVDHVPPAWIQQLAPGGVILADLRGSLAGGLVRLVRDEDDPDDDWVRGGFLALPGAFMPLRADLDSPHRHAESWDIVFDALNPHLRGTLVDPAELVAGADDHRHGLGLMVQLHLAGHRLRGLSRLGSERTVSGTSTDGSWCEVGAEPGPDGQFPLRQGGPARLWDTVEAAYRQWQHLGRPTVDRFGVTAGDHPALQHVWLDDEASPPRWPLPL